MACKQNYSFRLNEFGSNVKSTWKQLQIDKDFCDVTLACEDGHIQTHRIIVSHSSPVLKSLLKQSSNQNPVIYLRGVNYKHLESLFIFMHQGEVSVAEDDLENFLGVAEDLKIIGLSSENRKSFIPSEEFTRIIDGDQEHLNSGESLTKGKHKIQKSAKMNSNDCDPQATAATLSSENVLFRTSNLQNMEAQSSNQVSNLCKETNNAQKLFSVSDRLFSCNMCDKQYNMTHHLKRHKVAAHEGVRYPCDLCDAIPFTYEVSLKQHKASAHEGVRYPCDQCNDSTFYDPSTLKRHKISTHEGVRYACNSCNYKARQKWRLKNHTKNIHKT